MRIDVTSNILRSILILQSIFCFRSLCTEGHIVDVVWRSIWRRASSYIDANSRPSVHFSVTHSSVSYVVDNTDRCF